MNDLTGQPGELKATITITRKATGKIETYELTGTYQGDPDFAPIRQPAKCDELVWPLPKKEHVS